MLAWSPNAMATPTIEIEATYAGATSPLIVSGAVGKTISLVIDGFDGITTGTLTAKLTIRTTGPRISLSGGQLDSDNGTLMPLVIEVTAFDLTIPSLGVISDSDTFDFQSNSSATYASYYDPGNGAFAEQDLVGMNAFTGNVDEPSSQSYSWQVGGAITGAPYSMTEEFDIIAAPGGAPQVSSNVAYVPEPGAAGLLAMGLATLAMIRPMLRRPRC